MINLIIIKIKLKKNILLLIKKLIIIHLGRNPIKGGNPPKDKKLINKLILIIEFILLIKSWLIKNIFNI